MSSPRVALVLVVNGDGQLLMGKRGDSGLYVIPGGHVEPGEEPEDAAIRELGEEAGLDVDHVSPIKVYPATPERPELHLFSALAPQGVTPHGRRDPDQEVPTEDWEWVDARGGLPAKVMEHLHVPGDKNVLPGIYDLKKGINGDWRDRPYKFKISSRGDSYVLTAHLDGQRVGHVGYNKSPVGEKVSEGPTPNGTWEYRYNVYSGDIRPQHQGLGLYQEMLRQANEHAKSLGSLGLQSEKFQASAAARRAWSRTPGVQDTIPNQPHRGKYFLKDEDDLEKAAEHCALCGAPATARVRGVSGRARAACKAHVGKVLSQHGEGVAAVEHLRKGEPPRIKFKAAFRHPGTGQVVATGAFHDVGQLPSETAHEFDSGFVDEGGRFYDRREAARTLDPVWGHHRALDAANLEGDYRTVGDVYRGLGKSDGDSYATYRFPSEDEAETFVLHYRDRYEDDYKGLGVSSKCWPPDGKEGERVYVAVRCWDERNQEKAAALAREDGGETVQAPDESIYDSLKPEAFRPMEKAEVDPPPSEVRTLLGHPDPRERALALKLGSATAADAAHAALDPDSWVWRAALNHPVHGAHAKAALAASNRDHEGNLMHAQHAELRADPSLAPEHLQAMHRAWRDDSGNDLNLHVRVHEMQQTAAHPRFPHEGLGKSEQARGRLKSGSTQSTADASREVAPPHVGHLAEAWHRAGPKKEDDPVFHDLATNNEDYLSPKAIYSLPVAGHELPQRFMAKPYAERNDQLSGWGEGTSQALYHAAGIGHLHQDSFVAPHGHGETAVPATVIHMVRGKTYNNAPLDAIKKPGFKSDLARIALMDHAMAQMDRHDGNLLVREENGKPLAIDNAQAFSPMQPSFKHHLGGRLSEEDVAKELPWWRRASPDVRRALESRLSLIRDPHVRDSIARSFRGRADWLDQRAAEPTPNWRADVPLAKSLAAIPSEEGRMNRRENVPFSPEKMETLHRELAAAPMPHASERREHFETALNGSEAVAKPLKVTDLPAHAVSSKGGLLGAVRKAFYDSPAGHRYLVKGTHDAHHFGLGAWGEATSQALYHAAGIGHLHQHSHVSEIRGPDGKTAHGTVVHVEPDASTLNHAMENTLGRAEQLYTHPQNDQKLRQIAMMDAVTDNYDRHGDNLLVRRDGSPLAIDNAKVFEQDMDHGNPIEDLAAEPLGLRSDAWQSTDGPNSETWRWYYSQKPRILEAARKQMDLLPDREFREKTYQRFLDRLKRVEEYKR